MKKLITITTLGLALSFPSLLFAFDYMDLYTKPIAKSEVNNETQGGNVEEDFMSFYTNPSFSTNPKLSNTPTYITSDQKLDGDYICVFGVWIPRTT
jgi:hypothetical protein